MYKIQSYTLYSNGKSQLFPYSKRVNNIEKERERLEKKHHCHIKSPLGEVKKVKEIQFTFKTKHYA